jgi:hypothetical protein
MTRSSRSATRSASSRRSKPGYAGVVYRAPGDADAIAREVSRLLESDAERAALGRAGLQGAKRMTWTRTRPAVPPVVAPGAQ